MDACAGIVRVTTVTGVSFCLSIVSRGSLFYTHFFDSIMCWQVKVYVRQMLRIPHQAWALQEQTEACLIYLPTGGRVPHVMLVRHGIGLVPFYFNLTIILYSISDWIVMRTGYTLTIPAWT